MVEGSLGSGGGGPGRGETSVASEGGYSEPAVYALKAIEDTRDAFRRYRPKRPDEDDEDDDELPVVVDCNLARRGARAARRSAADNMMHAASRAKAKTTAKGK